MTARATAERFGRIFPDLPPFGLADERRRAALLRLGERGGMLDAKDDLSLGPARLLTDPTQSLANRDNPFHTAGTTFLGQFIEHDMTSDPTKPAALELDSVYGGGPEACPALFAEDGATMLIESGGRFEDVPRRPDGTALIADPRNDGNVVICGLHAAFILAHNGIVAMLRRQGVTVRLFERAARLLRWHYQWIVLHEYLPQVIGYATTQEILGYGRRWFRPEPGEAFVPVEFRGAAYRFGHSMVRPSYRVNLSSTMDGGPFDAFISDLAGGRRAAERYVDWQSFFNFGDGHVRPNKRIDRKLSTPLFHVPRPGHDALPSQDSLPSRDALPGHDEPLTLPQRTLLRHLTGGIPTGQRIAEAIGFAPMTLTELAPYGVGLEHQTPLWYYVLAEAELFTDGIVLGPVGARIVGEVLIGLLELDPRAYVTEQPDWTPTLPRRLANDFKMTDLLRFAGVDPISRSEARPKRP